MELVKTGKNKDVYKLPDGNYLLKFKDTAARQQTCEAESCCGSAAAAVEGTGLGALKMSVYFFDHARNANIPVHFISADLSKNEMVVQPAKLFGNGLVFVLRYKAAGCFIRRFGAYLKEGDALPEIFEVTLKDSARANPPATKEILMALNLLSHSQFDEIHDKTARISGIVYEDLKNRGLELFDIKLEFGIADGKVALIDELSARNMRVFKDGKRLEPSEISRLF